MLQNTDLKLSIIQLRSYWYARQGLNSRTSGQVADILRTSGWVNSPASTAPYLAMRARSPNLAPAAVDQAVFDGGAVFEVPAVRGCAMLVPKDDIATALRCARRDSADRTEKIRSACHITVREMENLCRAILDLLKREPLEVQEIRARVPEGMIRSLGPEGKRFGESSTLTHVLRTLQIQGSVLRFAVEKKLDSTRYAYRLAPWQEVCEGSPAENLRRLAERFFTWAAPATLEEFAWWSGANRKDARQAIESLRMHRVSIQDWTDEAWIPADQTDALAHAKVQEDGQDFRFLPFRDNFLYFRRGLAVFLDPEDRELEVMDWMNRRNVLSDQESLHYNAIVFRGRLAGCWEYDPEEKCTVWKTSAKIKRDHGRVLRTLMEDLAQFIDKELRDVRFYPFDTGTKRRARINSLR
jgi:hypothetical protein